MATGLVRQADKTALMAYRVNKLGNAANLLI
ncbi:Uncharacterised protein [Escherichia coli]|nr:Uncharacterised protein [Escherichia coli]